VGRCSPPLGRYSRRIAKQATVALTDPRQKAFPLLVPPGRPSSIHALPDSRRYYSEEEPPIRSKVCLHTCRLPTGAASGTENLEPNYEKRGTDALQGHLHARGKVLIVDLGDLGDQIIENELGDAISCVYEMAER
jgi:hypothetical protein